MISSRSSREHHHKADWRRSDSVIMDSTSSTNHWISDLHWAKTSGRVLVCWQQFISVHHSLTSRRDTIQHFNVSTFSLSSKPCSWTNWSETKSRYINFVSGNKAIKGLKGSGCLWYKLFCLQAKCTNHTCHCQHDKYRYWIWFQFQILQLASQ